MIIFKTVQLVVVTIIGAALWLFASVGIHEFGHVFGAKTMTKDEYNIQKVQIWPALEVYPDVKFSPATIEPLGDTQVQMVSDEMPQAGTARSARELPDAVESVRLGTSVAALPQRSTETVAAVDAGQSDRTREDTDLSVITLMGTVMTGFVSVLAVVCLVCFNLTGFKMFIASVLGMLHLDATLYSFLPSIGLPHLAVAGDMQPEPIAALAYFGILPMWSFTVFALLSFLQLGLVIHHWQKRHEN